MESLMIEDIIDESDSKEEEKPLEVKIIKEKEEPINPTSEDTVDVWMTEPTDEEIKEMTDAQ